MNGLLPSSFHWLWDVTTQCLLAGHSAPTWPARSWCSQEWSGQDSEVGMSQRQLLWPSSCSSNGFHLCRGWQWWARQRPRFLQGVGNRHRVCISPGPSLDNHSPLAYSRPWLWSQQSWVQVDGPTFSKPLLFQLLNWNNIVFPRL